MNKKQLQTEQTKQRVAESVRGLFAQKGYAATTIEDLVSASGCSKGNIYHHFKSKEGLFLYLIDEWDREWLEKWNEHAEQYTTVKEKLYGLAEFVVKDEFNHPLIKASDEFFGIESENVDIKQRIDQMMKGRVEFNKELLQQGMDSGEFKQEDAEMLAVVLESLLTGLHTTSRQYDIQQALALYRKSIEVFLHGISSS